MQYIFIALILTSFGFGLFTGFSINSSNVRKLEQSIEKSNAQAMLMLNEARKKTAEAQVKAIKANSELDKAHESSIKTINSLHDDLESAVTARLRSENSKSHCDAVSKSGDSRISKETASSKAEFSEKFARFLADQSRLADEVAIYADTANKFISNNCGIEHVR